MKYITICLLLLAACANNAIEAPERGAAETLTAFLAYLQRGETEEAAQLMQEGISGNYIFDIEEEYRALFHRLGYTHLSESVEGDRAYVSLTLYAIDFTALMHTLMAEFFDFFDPETDEEALLALMQTRLAALIASPAAPITRSEITVVLESTENGWRIQANADFVNAVLGGMPEFYAYARQWG